MLLSTKHPTFCSDTPSKRLPQHKNPTFCSEHPSKCPPQHKIPHLLFWASLETPLSAQSLPDIRWDLPSFLVFSRKMPGSMVGSSMVLCIIMENPLRFLSRFPASPKCTKEIFNKVRNCMKTRNLAFKFFGPKCWKFLQKMFVIQKKLLPLHPLNWGRLRPTSWYSIN